MISIKSTHEIEKMRDAAEIAKEALALIEEAVVPGVTTGEIDRIAYDHITKHNASPSFKGYRGFPGSVCASVNEEVIHGIPGLKSLKQGDIISIDIGVCYQGYHADCARTFPVGEVSAEAAKLIEVTRQSFFEGIAHAKAGERLSNISHAVQRHVEKNGFSVVREFVGHGVGSRLHEEPSVPNFGLAARCPRLYAGMTLAVEPMVNAGRAAVVVLDDGWTTVTKDGRLSAHYENTVLVTENEPVILTL